MMVLNHRLGRVEKSPCFGPDEKAGPDFLEGYLLKHLGIFRTDQGVAHIESKEPAACTVGGGIVRARRASVPLPNPKSIPGELGRK